ncbi:3-ketodihydrosphingosine reductase [Cydia strobilella]|uniref:3-ketodihydrosphingosine reductase n=1 Tax=Cydia strobilella TaxID=1100964 RepID=UPI0030071BE9
MYIIIGLLILAVIVGLAFAVYYSSEKQTVYTDLKGKHVVVTGGSSGIGKAAAAEAASLGAHVTIIGRDVSKLTAAVTEIVAKCKDKGQKIQFAALDVTSDYNAISKCLSELETSVGPIFMLINSAGMCICGEFDKMKVEDVKQMIDLNYFGTAYPTRYVLPGMKQRREGIVVFVASEAAFLGIYGYSAYSGGKWAVRGLAETLFMELLGTGVRLTLAFPPDTDTPGLKNENLTKPKETMLISGSGGLQSADMVGKKMVHDAMIGRKYSVFGFSGNLMSLLFCGSIDSLSQILVQISCMGILRTVMVGVLLYFHKIVWDGLKEKKETRKSK